MENNNFDYTYSAPEQKEIQRIRNKYAPKEAGKNSLSELRRLDKSVETPGTIISIIVGIVGTLIFGLGICFCLEWEMMIPGIIIGIIGVAILSSAYPLYTSITRKRREQLAPRILELTDALRH